MPIDPGDPAAIARGVERRDERLQHFRELMAEYDYRFEGERERRREQLAYDAEAEDWAMRWEGTE